MPAEELDALSQRIRQLYVAEVEARRKSDSRLSSRNVPAWDGGRDKYGRRHKPIWPKIAATYVAHGIDPEVAVPLAFEVWRPGSVPHPPPTFLASGTLLQAYKPSRDKLIKRTESAFLSAYRALSQQYSVLRPQLEDRGVKPKQILKIALLQRAGVHTPALFRYCMAANSGLPDLAEALFDEASREYLRRPRIYDEAWGDAIPDELRKLVTRREECHTTATVR